MQIELRFSNFHFQLLIIFILCGKDILDASIRVNSESCIRFLGVCGLDVFLSTGVHGHIVDMVISAPVVSLFFSNIIFREGDLGLLWHFPLGAHGRHFLRRIMRLATCTSQQRWNCLSMHRGQLHWSRCLSTHCARRLHNCGRCLSFNGSMSLRLGFHLLLRFWGLRSGSQLTCPIYSIMDRSCKGPT